MKKNLKRREKEKKAGSKRQAEDFLYVLCLCLSGLLLILLLWKERVPFPADKLLLPCMFHALTGLNCPGCGGTRAVKELLLGNFFRSFFYHPFVLYVFLLYVVFLFRHTLALLFRKFGGKHTDGITGKIKTGMRYRDAYLWIALAIVIVNFVIKNLCLVAFHLDLLAYLDTAF